MMTGPTEKTARRASAENPRLVDQQARLRIAEKARVLVVQLGTLVRALRFHSLNNKAIRDQLATVAASLQQLRRDGRTVRMIFVQGHTFVNGVWVRAAKIQWEQSLVMATALDKLNAQGIVIRPDFDQRSLLELAKTLETVAGDGDNPPKKVDIIGLELVPKQETNQVTKGRAPLRRTTFGILREILTAERDEMRQMELSTRRRQRSLVRRLVELAEDSLEDLLALSTVRDTGPQESSHALLVTVFAIALGYRIGLDRRDLVRLGVAALNHNIGQAFIDPLVTSQKRSFDREERATIETHPLLGMRFVLERLGTDRAMLERSLVSAEHHISWNGTDGYPVVTEVRPHPFSQIVAICDVFAALLSTRPQREAYPPWEAVRVLLDCRQLAPELVRVFVIMVGLDPPGSVVEMNSGEWGIVLGPGHGAHPLLRPRVLVVTQPDGKEMKEFFVFDLSTVKPDGHTYVRNVQSIFTPEVLGMKVTSYLLADRVYAPPCLLDNGVVVKPPPGKSASDPVI